MNEYPVIFKCSECTIEAANLDFLESHIWSRHLRCFPYKCSICSYPALNQQSLAIHFQDEHYEVPIKDVEFKRKISDEVKLREIIAASIVVPVFEEEEQIYDDQNQVPQVLESVVEEENALTDSITIDEMEVVDSQGQLIEGVQHEDTNGQVIYVSDKGIYQNYDKNGIDLLDDQEHDLTMQMDPNGQVVGIEDDNDDLVECEDDDGSYAIYSGHELLDETYQYIDADGNNVYVSHEYPHSFQSKDIPEMPMRQVRAMKSRHMDAIVNQVSKIQKNRRATTFWQCPECGKVIRYPSRIEAHRRQHRGEKPYSCRHCDQKFAQKGALKCHERLHSGERPYSCTWECGKTFVSASAQRMHEKLHSGERPFACNQCGRLFGKKSHLIRHEEGVHNIHTIEPHRSQPRGLEAAGKAEPILKNIVEEIVEGVRHERHEKQLKHREND